MRPTEQDAIVRLQRALDEIPSLKGKRSTSHDFLVWHRNTATAIERTFDDTTHVDDFKQITFQPATIYGDPAVAYSNGLTRAAALLSSMINEIGEYGIAKVEILTDMVGGVETQPAPVKTDQAFVVHGRNQKARDAMFTFLRTIGLHPLEWNEAVRATGKPMPYIGEILDAAFAQAGAVVVLMTPDDEARLNEPFRSPNDPPHETELTGQARPNVLFEAGMAMGRNAERTILVELGTLRPFSDVAGLHVIRMDNSSQRRQELAQRLESAGCPVNLEGVDWHTAGDFDTALLET
ncbi:MAG: nucleotide-binding protein [Chloroflexi bacterium]|nr:nucleotide-binding protein [Chloroflexota bacterium]